MVEGVAAGVAGVELDREEGAARVVGVEGVVFDLERFWTRPGGTEVGAV